MDRSRLALRLMLVFALCLASAIVLAGSRPAGDPGLAPWLVQAAGYACGVLAAVLLLASRDGGPAPGAARRVGLVLLPAVLGLLLLDVVVVAASSGGANIGAGLLRILLFVVIGGATLRLARGGARERPRR